MTRQIIIGIAPPRGRCGCPVQPAAFTFGYVCGAVERLLAAMHIPMTLVPPQTWKKRAGRVGTDKDSALSRAVQLWLE